MRALTLPPPPSVVPKSRDVVAHIRMLLGTNTSGQIMVKMRQRGVAEGMAAQILASVPDAQIIHAAWLAHDATFDTIRTKAGINSILVLIILSSQVRLVEMLSIRTQHVVTIDMSVPVPAFNASLAQTLGDVASVVFELNSTHSLPMSNEPVSDSPDAVVVLDAHAANISISRGTPIVLWETPKSVAPYKRAKLKNYDVFRPGMPGIVLHIGMHNVVTAVLASGAVVTFCSDNQPYPFVHTKQVLPRFIAHLPLLHPLFMMNTSNNNITLHL